MSRDIRPPVVPRRQFLVGSGLVFSGIFVAVTRDNASEWLVGTLVGLGLLAIGVALPSGFPWNGSTNGNGKRDKEDE